MTGREVLPHGAWRSRLSVDEIVADAVGLAEPWIDGDAIYWIESRPREGGRRVLVRHDPDGSTRDVVPAGMNVRNRVHEYGGGSYTARAGVVVCSDFATGRLHRIEGDAGEPVPITPDGPFRYADLRIEPSLAGVLAVREDHGGGGEPRNELVLVPLAGDAAPVVLVSGPDFVAAPRLAPDGRRLAWLEWDHPAMPWDAVRLRVGRVDGPAVVEPVTVAGGDDESIVGPVWDASGGLIFLTDRTGWWNPARWAPDTGVTAILPEPAEIEFADPPWLFDRSSLVALEDGTLLAIGRAEGRDRLYRIVAGRPAEVLPTPFTELDGLRAGGTGLVAVAAHPTSPSLVVRLDPAGAITGVLARGSRLALEPDDVSTPEPIAFPTTGGWTAHALFYPPANATCEAPPGERPPLVVLSHGGPTANASTALDLAKQLLTSRGIAVVDVDYRGSTGYGRAYRNALDGAWGIADVDDCIAAARFLVERGDVDPERMAIQGGSAGGYTTLCALTFHDVFAAGISYYGVADLELLVSDTHKFEAQYEQRLVAPYPEGREVYRERSPIHALDRLACPLLILQGLDDRVVPPSQAEAIVAALEAKGLPYAYLAFPGEGHGFRSAAAIRRSLEAELSFLAQVFGFELADPIEPVEVVGLDRWRAGRQRR